MSRLIHDWSGKNYKKFYKDINKAVKDKDNSIFYDQEDLVVGRRPNEDKKLLIEVNYGNKRIKNNQIEYTSWIILWEYEHFRNRAEAAKYSHHKIHTTFMSIDKMSDFLLDLYRKLKRATFEETCQIMDEYENYFDNLEAKEESTILHTEKELEDYLVDFCRQLGWKCEKQNPKKLGKGVPDRKITKDDGTVVFVELKTPKKNGHISFDQYSYHEKLRNEGYEVKVIWSKEQVDELLSEV